MSLKLLTSNICPICNTKFNEGYPAIMEILKPKHHKHCFLPYPATDIKQCLDNKDVKSALNKIYPSDKFIATVGLGTFYSDTVYESLLRNAWITKYCSWHLPPTYEQLLEIKDFIGQDQAIEVGAGKGLFTAFLQAMDIKIVGCDPHCNEKFTGTWITNDMDLSDTKDILYTPVIPFDINTTLENYGHMTNVLISAWGSYNISEENCKQFKGQKVIIIGEREGGCTSCGYLQEKCENGDGWELVKEIKIPIFSGLHDSCCLYQRKIVD